MNATITQRAMKAGMVAMSKLAVLAGTVSRPQPRNTVKAPNTGKPIRASAGRSPAFGRRILANAA